MTRVVTITMNPAIDVTTSVGSVAANRKLRCETPRYEPGGGGLNVSVAMDNLGYQSTAVYPCGGLPGEIMQQLLQDRGIDHRPVRTEEWTRCNLAARDESSDDQYRFVMPGPTLDENEILSCLDTVAEIEPKPDYLVISGSFPPGVPPETMRNLISLGRKLQASVVVDTSGDALQVAAEEGVFLLKPNMRELSSLSGEDLSTEAAQERAMRNLVDRCGCQVAVLSVGAAGVLLATKDGLRRLRAPTVPIVSRVGAGDSMVAGVMAGICRGYPVGDAVKLGVAAGSAAVMTPGTQLCRKDDTERLYGEIRDIQ